MTVESAVERIVYDCAADIDLEEIEWDSDGPEYSEDEEGEAA